MQAAETAGLLNLVPSVSVLTLFSTARGNEVEASGFPKSARLGSYYIYLATLLKQDPCKLYFIEACQCWQKHNVFKIWSCQHRYRCLSWLFRVERLLTNRGYRQVLFVEQLHEKNEKWPVIVTRYSQQKMHESKQEVIKSFEIKS